MITLDEFIQKYTGKSGVGNTPQNINQCVGLVSLWMDNFGIPHEFGNAKDLLNDADTQYVDVIQNTPAGVPTSGDIMVWGDTWGNGYGHTGIFCSGDANNFNCFEQNDPDGSTPHAKEYNYDGVLGWLHIKALDQTNATGQPDALQECLKQHDQLVTLCDQKDQEITQLKTTQDNLNNIIKDKDQTISQLQGQVSSLTSQLTDANTALESSQAIAKQVPGLQTELATALNDRRNCLLAQEGQQKTIAQLKLQIANGKPKGFINKLLWLFTN